MKQLFFLHLFFLNVSHLLQNDSSTPGGAIKVPCIFSWDLRCDLGLDGTQGTDILGYKQ